MRAPARFVTPAPEPALLTIRAVAATLAVSQRQVWKWHEAGLLTVIKFPGHRTARIERTEVVRFIASFRCLKRPIAPISTP
jgi:excisionase family DNA binding protein